MSTVSLTTPPSGQLRDRAAAEAYVASVCFKHGPPKLLGVELEWIVQHADGPARPLDAEHLADALGAHAPASIRPGSPNLPLPAGSAVTVEPGGQVEISTLPRDSLSELIATTDRDRRTLTGLLTAAGLRLADTATDPYRPVNRILGTPRYLAQYDAYDREGPDGVRMMCNSAAIQVCVDAGSAEQAASRWRTLYALGPVLVAAFANSPALEGGPTGWASTRMRLWSTVGRGAHPPPDAARYAAFALSAPPLCVRDGSARWPMPPLGLSFADWIGGALDPPPTWDDLDFHLTTLFPPVRPRGHLEVRYLDAQPPDRWALPVAVLTALLSTDEACERAYELSAPTAGRWTQAARLGLADPPLAMAAVEVFELACALLPALDPPDWLHRELELTTQGRVRHGLTAARGVATP